MASDSEDEADVDAYTAASAEAGRVAAEAFTKAEAEAARVKSEKKKREKARPGERNQAGQQPTSRVDEIGNRRGTSNQS